MYLIRSKISSNGTLKFDFFLYETTISMKPNSFYTLELIISSSLDKEHWHQSHSSSFHWGFAFVFHNLLLFWVNLGFWNSSASEVAASYSLSYFHYGQYKACLPASNEQTIKRSQVNLHFKHQLSHFLKGPLEHYIFLELKCVQTPIFFCKIWETRSTNWPVCFTEEKKHLAKGPKFTYRLRQNIHLIDLPSGWFLVHFLVKIRKTIWGTVKQVPLKWAARACSKNNQSGFPRNPLIITLLRQALSLARALSSSQVSWAWDHTPPLENRINPSSGKGNLRNFIANQKI